MKDDLPVDHLADLDQVVTEEVPTAESEGIGLDRLANDQSVPGRPFLAKRLDQRGHAALDRLDDVVSPLRIPGPEPHVHAIAVHVDGARSQTLF